MTRLRRLGRRGALAAAAAAVVAAGLGVAAVAPVSLGGPSATSTSSMSGFPTSAVTQAATASGARSAAAASPAGGGATGGVASNGQSSSAALAQPLAVAPPVTTAAGPAVGGATATAPVVPTDTVVRTGSLTLEVAKGGFGRGFSDAASIARDVGGFVVTAAMGPGSGPLPGDVGAVGPATAPTTAAPPAAGASAPTAGTLVMRVPGSRFDEARRRLEALGSLQGEQLSGQDAGGQLSDLAARIADLRAEQDGLRAMAARATSTGDLLQIEAQLGAVHAQLDGLLAQQAELGNQVALASITLTMAEPPPVAPAPRSLLRARAGQAGHALEAIAGGALVALAYLGPFALLAALVALLITGSRRRRAAIG